MPGEPHNKTFIDQVRSGQVRSGQVRSAGLAHHQADDSEVEGQEDASPQLIMMRTHLSHLACYSSSYASSQLRIKTRS